MFKRIFLLVAFTYGLIEGSYPPGELASKKLELEKFNEGFSYQPKSLKNCAIEKIYLTLDKDAIGLSAEENDQGLNYIQQVLSDTRYEEFKQYPSKLFGESTPYQSPFHRVKTLSDLKILLNFMFLYDVRSYDIQDIEGNTPFHKFIIDKKCDLAQLLLDSIGKCYHDGFEDIMINTRNNLGQTPLLNAIKAGNLTLSRLILSRLIDQEKQSNINSPDATNLYPLMAAILYLPEFVKDLLNNGADVNLHNNKETPLQLAISEQPDLVPLLLERGALIDPPIGYDPLYIAVRYNPSLVDILINQIVKHKADINRVYPDGETILDYVKKYRPALVDKFIKAGARDTSNEATATVEKSQNE